MIVYATKVCPGCRRELELLASFCANRTTSNGFQSKCRDCNRSYRDAHKAEISARNRAYASSHRRERGEYYRQHYQANKARRKEQRRVNHFRSLYGMTLAERDEMIASQAGLCALCSEPLDLSAPGRGSGCALSPVVDHCHTTGRVRGILHHKCNSALGHYEKVRELAESYLAGAS